MAAPLGFVAFTETLLQSEITNDPAAIGYAGATSDQAKADLLNANIPSSNVWRNDIKLAEVVNSIVAADFAAMTALQIQKLQLVLQQGVIDATVANTRTIFTGIFTGMNNTVTAITALAQRSGSRAEVLWGPGVKITATQVGIARNGS